MYARSTLLSGVSGGYSISDKFLNMHWLEVAFFRCVQKQHLSFMGVQVSLLFMGVVDLKKGPHPRLYYFITL